MEPFSSTITIASGADSSRARNFLLGATLLAHVADRARDQQPPANLDRAQADLDRKLAAVRLAPEELEAQSPWAVLSARS